MEVPLRRIIQRSSAPVTRAALNRKEQIIHLYVDHRMSTSAIARALDLPIVDVMRIIRAGKGKGD